MKSVASSVMEREYEEDDRRRIDKGVPRARREKLTICMRCFNKEEADTLRAYALSKYPDVSFHFTWLEFQSP